LKSQTAANCLYGVYCTLGDTVALYDAQFHIDQQDQIWGLVITCNGLSALKQAQKISLVEPTTAHYNLIGAIWHLQAAMRINVTFEHIKGHQDNEVPTVLSLAAWMNIEMKQLAKAHVDLSIPIITKYAILDEGWICLINGCWKVKDVLGRIQNYVNGLTINKHWLRHKHYCQRTQGMISWGAADCAMKALLVVQ